MAQMGKHWPCQITFTHLPDKFSIILSFRDKTYFLFYFKRHFVQICNAFNAKLTMSHTMWLKNIIGVDKLRPPYFYLICHLFIVENVLAYSLSLRFTCFSYCL